MLNTKFKGAFNIVTGVLFYGADGKISFVKTAIFAAAVYYFAFLNPMMLMFLLEVGLICIVATCLWRIAKAFIYGDLEKYADPKAVDV